MKGFFPNAVWQEQRTPLTLLPECGKCGLDQACKAPYMKPSGKGEKKVLIIGEAPTTEDDERGFHLSSQYGMKLVQTLHRLGINMRRDCNLTYAVVCHPPRNREPSKEEIGFCRPNLSKTLFELKPNVVIPMGEVAIKSIMALAWKDGEVDNEDTWAGWQIPCQSLNTWICPTYSPKLLLKEKQPVAEKLIIRHLKAAFELESVPWPDGPPNYKKQLRVVADDVEAAACIKKMMNGQPVAVDIETTCLKPESPHAEILCCSLSDGRISYAFPWRGEVLPAMKELLLSSVPKVVANQRFEDRWFRKFLGIWTKNWAWDTLLAAHWLNCTHGICSVKFQAWVLFGIEDYDRFVDKFKGSKDRGGNSPNRMKELEYSTYAEYCAMDSLFEMMIAQEQAQQARMVIA